MEKIQPFLKGCYENRFWIACSAVVIASLVTWYMTANAIEEERAKYASDLDNKKRAIDSVLTTTADVGQVNVNVGAHPNELTKKGMDERIGDASVGALEAWRIRWDQQDEILSFAPEIPDHVRQALEKYTVPEALDFGEKDPIVSNMRFTFKENIHKRMPKLAAIIGSTWKHEQVEEEPSAKQQAGQRKPPAIGAGGGRSGGRGGGTSGSGERLNVGDDVVVWDEKNQDMWNTKVTQFAGFFGNNDVVNNNPSTHQMLALQQDLWILEAMLQIIADVNKGFTANDLAPIERIDHILIGHQAFNKIGKLSEITIEPSEAAKKAAATSTAGEQGGITAKRQRVTMRSQRAQYAPTDTVQAFDPEASDSPFHGRYVDREYKPLSVDQIRKVVTSKELTDQSYLAVAKRVPIRVAVKMDERKIGEFLAAAANSPFNFEVRQVRLNRHVPGEGVDLTASLNAAKRKGNAPTLARGGGGGGAKADDDANTAGGGGAGGVGGDSLTGEQRQSFDVKVEFVGIVKLYNPVNPALFGVDEKTVDTQTASPTAGR